MTSPPNTKPNPDPTIATNEAVTRAVKSERDYVDGQIAVLVQRLNAIDKATIVFSESLNRVPTDTQKEVSHLKELTFEKFDSVSTQFSERDTRSERESKDNKVAVDAAFAAQKEAASEQNKSNTLAIDKSEKATAETLNKQADLFKSTTDAIVSQVNDVKERVSKIENVKQGSIENRTETRDNRAAIYAAVGFGVMIVLALITVLGFAIAKK